MAGGFPIGSAYLSAASFTTILIQKPVFPIGEYKIKVSDIENNTLFLVKGTSTSLHKQRVLIDSSGKTILTLRMKWTTVHQRWHAFRGASTDAEDLIFTTKTSSVPLPLEKYLEDFDLHVCRGDSDRVSYSVHRHGDSFGIDQFNVNTTHYMAKVTGDRVSVSPNVDMAFIVSLIAILDAMIVQKEQGQTAELVVWKKVGPAAKIFLPHTWLPSSILIEGLKYLE